MAISACKDLNNSPQAHCVSTLYQPYFSSLKLVLIVARFLSVERSDGVHQKCASNTRKSVFHR